MVQQAQSYAPTHPTNTPQIGVRRIPNRTRLHLHSDFHNWLADAPPGQRAAALRALEALVAHGRPNRIKGVKGHNAGWLRTPVGGTNGQQFYLWFAGQGSAPVGDQIGPGEFLVRAVRHHDRTDEPLAAGHDWAPMTPAELLDEVDRDHPEDHPLSLAQRQAARCNGPLQVIQGSPGAGKTTALLHGVRNLDGRVLYMTFGSALVSRARQWFDAFLEDGAEIATLTVGEWLTRIGGKQRVARDPDLRARGDILISELSRFAPNLGPWVHNGVLQARDLYDELHAHYFGWSPAEWNEEAYVARRSPTIGAEAAKSAAKAAHLLSDDVRHTLFPGPLSANDLLRDGMGDLSEFEEIDWLVVDEVQDLTVIELEVVVAFMSRLTTLRGRRPGLRLAGDEGQTLRPTGFAWPVLKNRLNELGRVDESVLAANLRSTREVAGFVQTLTTECYRQRLPRERRPGGQRQVELDPVEGGECMLVVADKPDDDLGALIETVAKGSTLVEVGRAVDTPVALAARTLDARYFTSETAKGLDFETVAVFGLGRTLIEMKGLANGATTEPHNLERVRLLADHARVAASRAVSRVIIAETDEAEAKAVMALFDQCAAESEAGGLTRLTLAQVRERLDSDPGDAIGLLIDALKACEEVLERDPDEALRHAERALTAFRRAGRSQAVGTDIRRRVYLSLGRARLTLTGSTERSDEALARAQSDFREAGEALTSNIISWLRDAEKKTSLGGLITALEHRSWVTRDGVDPWVRALIAERYDQALTALCTRVADQSDAMSVADARKLWPHLVGSNGPQANLSRLATPALRVLATSRADAKSVMSYLADHEVEDGVTLRAMALDTLDDDDAVAAWLAARVPARAVEFLRRHGDFRRALALVEANGLGPNAALTWAVSLADLMAQLATIQRDSLTAAEVSNLRALVPSFLVRSGERKLKRT
jgi:hypothetical protein